MRRRVGVRVGGLFGTGPLVSGMTDTAKVQGFPDVFGQWDATPAFVMGGAIAPMAAACRPSRNRRPVLGGTFPAHPSTRRDAGLIGGSVPAGTGCGLVSLCPGPGARRADKGGTGGLVRVGAMIPRMVAAPPLRKRLDARPQQG
ncbi:hypothetical protein SAMN05444339_105214 [Loktanella atrilutea]|uniref:Uncharacterized protein n=1 Tax=Loktanella atrilutea TaxID=366533 RepID=A0A1M5B2X4_LOKAT|nr:DUF6691 family protein [Loktanella atrilutea]SHF36911.1 hypothetical protein SAMN05444339_105214 [Loktanella atrilutea]